MIYFDSSYPQHKELWDALQIPYIAYSERTEPRFLKDAVVDQPECEKWGVTHQKSSENNTGYDLDDMSSKALSSELANKVSSLQQSDEAKVTTGREPRFDSTVLKATEESEGKSSDSSQKRQLIDNRELSDEIVPDPTPVPGID